MKSLIIFCVFFALAAVATVSGSERIAGGIRRLDEQEVARKQEKLAKSLSVLAAGDGPSYTIDKVYSASTQVVAGSLDRFDVDLIDGKTGEKTRCLVSLWSRGWLKENGYELTFECKDKQKVIKRHSRSVENEGPSIIVGGYNLEGEELVREQGNIAKSLNTVASLGGPSYTIDKVYSGKFGVVTGYSIKLDVDLIEAKTGVKSRCLVELWSQPWLKVDGYQLTIDCKDKQQVVQRYSR